MNVIRISVRGKREKGKEVLSGFFSKQMKDIKPQISGFFFKTDERH